MTNLNANSNHSKQPLSTTDKVKLSLNNRYAAEKRFKFLGRSAISLSLLFLAYLLFSIISKGLPAFTETQIKLDIHFDQDTLGISTQSTDKDIKRAKTKKVIRKSLLAAFPEVSGRKNKKSLYALISSGAEYQLIDQLIADRDLLNQTVSYWLTADDDIDTYAKGNIDISLPQNARRVNDLQIELIKQLRSDGRLRRVFNTTLFTSGDSREPEQAGILGALIGSLYTLMVTLALSFPIGVAAACYLEEFAPKNRFTDLIEININNLAAVPSIVFGILGLAIFINFFGMPRSAPLVGGIVLSLMTLPTIIIASRAALRAVPPSIRDAALGLGASRLQALTHHVLPLATPGILTGSIIGMAQALGETAPLLMIGMVAFIVDIPGAMTDPATVMPVQIFLWSDSPERAFTERTSAAIMVLLGFLILMNAIAVFLRKRFERRW